jgi:hypothetical protein
VITGVPGRDRWRLGRPRPIPEHPGQEITGIG